jgi:hypothetical protein
MWVPTQKKLKLGVFILLKKKQILISIFYLPTKSFSGEKNCFSLRIKRQWKKLNFFNFHKKMLMPDYIMCFINQFHRER